MRNDPGAWGSANPRFLVLGFSKGATQASIYSDGSFDDVAFGGDQTRNNLTRILQVVGILRRDEHVSEKIRAKESEFHFGSLVRCSLARINEQRSRAMGKRIYETSGGLILKAFSELPDIIRTCSTKYLLSFPTSVKAVLVLGSNDGYIKKMKHVVRTFYPHTFKEINSVAYETDALVWIHLAHPSKGNGHLSNWLEANSSNPSGRKREMAIEIIKTFNLKASIHLPFANDGLALKAQM
jgi:hypothetical protein